MTRGFMANVVAACMQQILHIPQREQKPDISNDGQADNLRRRFEIAKRIRLCHTKALEASNFRCKPVSSDNAFVSCPHLKALRRSVRASLVRVSCLHAAFSPESASREFGTVLCRGVPAFAYLRIEYLALFAHVVGFTHVASES